MAFPETLLCGLLCHQNPCLCHSRCSNSHEGGIFMALLWIDTAGEIHMGWPTGRVWPNCHSLSSLLLPSEYFMSAPGLRTENGKISVMTTTYCASNMSETLYSKLLIWNHASSTSTDIIFYLFNEKKKIESKSVCLQNCIFNIKYCLQDKFLWRANGGTWASRQLLELRVNTILGPGVSLRQEIQHQLCPGYHKRTQRRHLVLKGEQRGQWRPGEENTLLPHRGSSRNKSMKAEETGFISQQQVVSCD